ncbi:MAG: BamA/TamA family outer membrane protein [Ignavibacteria bacterium]|nr:BamA/TamA family outer membrane protein [Ignavibacteria bacterium]
MKNIIIILFIITIVLSAFSQEDKKEEESFKITDIDIEIKSDCDISEKEVEQILQINKLEYFNYTDFDLDIRRIDKYFFDNGYFDVAIDTQLIIDKDEKEIEVIFTIEPGKEYKINQIKYNGLNNIYPTAAEQIFNDELKEIKEGQRYIRNNLQSEITRVINILNNYGYLNALAENPDVEKIISNSTELKNKVNINLNFNTGPIYKFGKTYVEINNNPKGLVIDEIYKDLEYKEGDLYSKKALIESENRISNIEMLENARIQIKNIDSVNKIIDFVVTASLTSRFSLQPEISGYDILNRFYAGASLSFTDKYFLGGGRKLVSKGSAFVHSEDVYLFELGMQLYQPYVFNNNKITGNLNLSWVYFKDDIFSISAIKNVAGLSYELPKHTYINSFYSSWEINNSKFTINAPFDYITKDSVITLPEYQINLFTSIILFNAIHNNTNNFQFPSRGNYQSYLIEESGLLSYLVEKVFSTSTFRYVKFSSINKFYFSFNPPNETTVLACKFLIGALFEYAKNKYKISGIEEETDIDIPIPAKFIAGGSTSIRGWQAKKLGTFPTREFGGNFLIEGSFELRTKPFYYSKTIFKELGFVSFIDYGNLWRKPRDFRFSDIAIAIGGGLRYYTIVGPVRFDIGFKLYDYEAESNGTKPWLFENNISTIFKNKVAFQIGIGHTF